MAERDRFFVEDVIFDFSSSASFRFFWIVRSGGGVMLVVLDDASEGRREIRDVGAGDIVKVGVGT
jgi:hypothetical protein